LWDRRTLIGTFYAGLRRNWIVAIGWLYKNLRLGCGGANAQNGSVCGKNRPLICMFLSTNSYRFFVMVCPLYLLYSRQDLLNQVNLSSWARSW
jgi:hypothetical protein